MFLNRLGILPNIATQEAPQGAPSQLSHRQAISIAKNECARRQWPWGQPKISEGALEYRVRSKVKGQKETILVAIDMRNGDIKAAHRLPY